jgi:BirA family biotin operon repressor/biotin-[acetyl-CoA-carboxylase] ligase
VRGQTVEYVVVGMGLNVNLDPAELPDVMAPPTSLLAETGAPVDRLDLLAALLLGVEDRARRMAAGWSPHTEWRQHLTTLGYEVAVGTEDAVVSGTAVDVDADGALLVRTPSGDVRRVLVGDVTLRGHRTG